LREYWRKDIEAKKRRERDEKVATTLAELSAAEKIGPAYPSSKRGKTRAVGVVVSHPLSIREALGSVTRPSIFGLSQDGAYN
jgi:hypothetical protein